MFCFLDVRVRIGFLKIGICKCDSFAAAARAMIMRIAIAKSLFALLARVRLFTFIRIDRRDVDGSDNAVHHRDQGLDNGNWSANDRQKLEGGDAENCKELMKDDKFSSLIM